jgi:putative Ca2+/H+ antiporter (TMEM165/GDT1 family)
VTVGTAFFLAELGDKTMLATITLATTEEPWGTWLGSTAGMVAADALAIAVGAVLGTRLPERAIKVFAALAFVAFGIVLLAEALGAFGR